ncbi:hypothetical protein CPB84DRAFT_1856155 [Gymnopilus junonius]|uniref:Uncharacterized protein n=1 Tax=Gymnopilus junonius TaxID=109634 RepID=A0A9P5N6W6_GYMJU|nr:hypothetical protein CPB84DRAFT_1856155 [Gymnopilus junonius]
MSPSQPSFGTSGLYPYGVIDCYGIKRTSSGKAIFGKNMDDGTPLISTDAYLIVELPSLAYDDPHRFFITSANMNWIPDLSQDSTSVYVQQDFFKGTYYMPFIMKKPLPEDMAYHEYWLLWYNLQDDEFVLEPGAMLKIGMIQEDLHQELVTLRWKIHHCILNFLKKHGFTQNCKEVHELMHSNRGQHFTNIALECNIHIGHTAWEYGLGDMPENAQAAAGPSHTAASSATSSVVPPPSESPFGTPYEPSSYVKLGQQVNLTKFEKPSSPRCPEASPFWSSALAFINPTWQEVYDHRNQSLLHGYPFLDPFVLCGDGWVADFQSDQQILYGLQERSDVPPGKRQHITANVSKLFNFELPISSQSIDICWWDQVVVSVASIQAGQLTVPDKI